jgi:phosphoglycolate phosphatase-like HAD superfamily hydrolase
MREFYRTDRIYNTKPVPGAREGTESLRQMGFRLIIVTARSEDNADESWEWVERYFPGIVTSYPPLSI